MTQTPAHTNSVQNRSKSNVDYRALLGKSITKLKELLEQEQHLDLLSPLQSAMRRFELGLFRLVVMGEIKKGKSSFINALLGEHGLLPTFSDVATSTVFKVLYGPERKFKVFFLADVDTGKRREPLEIATAELSDYGTESGNPKNERQVDFIGVELPHPLLKKGLVLVDTPGVGGLFRAHRDISWRYAPNADAIFFVLDSVEAVISRDEIQFLKELTSKVTKRVFFVQSKIDNADSEQWRSWQARNKQILCEHLGIKSDQLYYFPVSAELKKAADDLHDGRLLIDSGFLAVLDFLNHGLIESKDREMARDIACQIDMACQQLQNEFQQQMQICQDQSKEELERIRKEFLDAKTELECWERTTYQEAMHQFGDRFADIRQKWSVQFQDELDPAGPAVTSLIRELRDSDATPDQLVGSAPRIQQDWLAVIAERTGGLQREFNKHVSQLVSETSDKLTTTPNAPIRGHLLTQSQTAVQTEIDPVRVNFGAFEATRNALYGGMAGVTIGHIAVGVLAMVFPPAAAVGLIATIAGGLIGSSMAAAEMTARRREEVLAKLQAILQNLARRCQRQAMNQFNEIVTGYERYARDAFREAAEQARRTLQERLKQIENATARSRDENQERHKALQAKVEKVKALRQHISAVPAKRANSDAKT
jgi:hypothetical protein